MIKLGKSYLQTVAIRRHSSLSSKMRAEHFSLYSFPDTNPNSQSEINNFRDFDPNNPSHVDGKTSNLSLSLLTTYTFKKKRLQHGSQTKNLNILLCLRAR